MVFIHRDKVPIHSSKLLAEYLDFLRQHQCVADATVVIRKAFVAPFLVSIGKLGMPSRLIGLSAKMVHDYIIAQSGSLHRASKKHLSSSLRSFLRFAHIRGYLKRSLVEAVPVIATRKLDRLPRGIPWKAVQKLLRTPDRRTHVGRRNYAILLLLASYGVRIGQVTRLKLKDIRWTEGVINFQPSKGCQALCLPLQKSVVQALLAYIKRDRRQLPFLEVFLTTRQPQRPLSRNNHLNSALSVYYKRAGIDSAVKGSHSIRHAFATRLMEKGTSIKTIADLLGHRSIDNTFLYTKVDIPHLRVLARKWPEVIS